MNDVLGGGDKMLFKMPIDATDFSTDDLYKESMKIIASINKFQDDVNAGTVSVDDNDTYEQMANLDLSQLSMRFVRLGDTMFLELT
jgi:hypothetical protein